MARALDSSDWLIVRTELDDFPSPNLHFGFTKMASASRRCIFCLKRGTTDEHVFADWLRVLFPRTAKDTRSQGITQWGQDRHGKLYAMPLLTIQQGHSGSKKVPYVCRGCNNGWMSRMEKRTRPILMPLIQGIPHSKSTFDLQYLATWIAKTVMVAEYAFPDHISIPDRERLHMYANLAPPDNWTIWIADYRGFKWRNLAIFHHMGRVLPPKPPEPSKSTSPDTHFTSIGMGHVFIQVVGTNTGLHFDSDNDAFRRIWPLSKLALTWPPARPILDDEADFIANSFARIMKLPLAASG